MGYLRAIKKHVVIMAAVALWLPAVGYGINVMWTYATTPGHPAEPPRFLPANGSIARSGDRATLLLFAHPQCECTRATLAELEILMAHTNGKLDVDVFFYRPAIEDSAWARSDLWRAAAGIPGIHLFEDRDAEIARRFGVFTSGQALLYSSKGILLFQGGITAYRGHSGDNAGRDAITALLQGVVPPQSRLPVVTRVFGCSLRGA
jgi:hypothetical protein